MPRIAYVESMLRPFGGLGINHNDFELATLHMPSLILDGMKVHGELSSSVEVQQLAAVQIVGGPDSLATPTLWYGSR